MAIQDILTQIWVKTTGRKLDINQHQWLIGPIGDTDIIKNQFVYNLAKSQNLNINENLENAGLLENLEDIGIVENDHINPKVADFYLHTSKYNLDIVAEWRRIFLPFGMLLKLIFSNRLQQLNLPINQKDFSEGVDSKIIKLKSKTTNETVWTIWYRIAKKSQNVIFSGIYTNCINPNYQQPLFKLIFPLPNGNASIIMRKEILKDGSLVLSSDGKKFGETGFYFTLTDHNGNYWSKFVKTMHERLQVYEDLDKNLKAKHQFSIWNIQFLTLHYSISPKKVI